MTYLHQFVYPGCVYVLIKAKKPHLRSLAICVKHLFFSLTIRLRPSQNWELHTSGFQNIHIQYSIGESNKLSFYHLSTPSETLRIRLLKLYLQTPRRGIPLLLRVLLVLCVLPVQTFVLPVQTFVPSLISLSIIMHDNMETCSHRILIFQLGLDGLIYFT